MQQGMLQMCDDQMSRRHSSETVYSNCGGVQFEQCPTWATRPDPCDMFMRQQPKQMSDLEDLHVLTPAFEEDDEMAAARDVVTADLKCFQECLANCSTPPPTVQQGAHAQCLQQQPPPQPQQQVFMKQEPSGAAGSTCGGASSPQVSCDTAAARAQQFWAPQQQQYEAAYGLIMEHSPINEFAGPLHAYGGAPPMGGPCTGPCCNPGVLPQGTLPHAAGGAAVLTDYASMAKMPYQSVYRPAGMVPHAATGMQFSMHGCTGAAAGAAVPPPAAAQLQQPRAFSSYPPVKGGVHKRSGTSKPPTDTSARRRSGDGSCSSKDGTPAPVPTKAKKSKVAAAPSAPAARSRGSGSAAGHGAAAAAAAGSSTASLIKELQQEIEVLTASKSQLKGQVRNLLNSQTNLLSRVATVTTKWQQAVAENANLQRHITLLAGQGA